MKLKYSLLIIIQISLLSAAHAKSFKEIEACGSADVTEGTTCEKAIVNFKFDGCKSNLPAHVAKSVTCKNGNIVAKYSSGNYRYEARILKISDSWGAVSWKLEGNVKQFFAETTPVAVVAPAPVAVVAPVPVAVVAPAPVAVVAPAPVAVVAPAPVAVVAPVPVAVVAPVPVAVVAPVPVAVVAPVPVAVVAPAPVAVVAPAPVAVVAPIPVIATQAAEASAFKFNSFFDIRYSNYNVNNNPNVSSGNPESGFGLEDAAVYANYEKGNVLVLVDVAIRRSKDYDINVSATKPNQSSNNNLAIGIDKSQLYLRYKITPALIFDFGQFDTIFGVEVNDSKDRVFGKTGLVYDNTLPVTHTGFMLEYTYAENIYLKAFIANPNNKGTFGSSLSGDDTPEVGVALGYASDNYHAQIGHMSRKIKLASGIGKNNRTLLDVFLGGVVGKFSFDLEGVALSDPSKNTLTTSDASDKEKTGEGYFTLLSYKFTPVFQVGMRFEYLRNDPAAQSIKSSASEGVSLHYKLTSEVELRSEYTSCKNKGLSGTEWEDSRFNVATVVTF